jgi:DNA-binding CsgD family transcriptional regulator
MAGYFAEAGQSGAARPFGQLTAREREILELMAAGAGNGAIAGRLGLTEKTIRNNVSSIFVKLSVTDRAAAVARARDANVGIQVVPAPAARRAAGARTLLHFSMVPLCDHTSRVWVTRETLRRV